MAEEKALSFLRLIRRAQRGKLKVYLGYGAGVGKTWQMLKEGQRLLKEGVDVVVGLVETHGRAETAELKQRERNRHCNARFFNPFGSWDILALAAETVKPGGTGKCEKTVEVSGKCYRQQAVNYVLWGKINSLCGNVWTMTWVLTNGGKWFRGYGSDVEVTGWTMAGFYGTWESRSTHEKCECLKLEMKPNKDFHEHWDDTDPTGGRIRITRW